MMRRCVISAKSNVSRFNVSHKQFSPKTNSRDRHAFSELNDNLSPLNLNILAQNQHVVLINKPSGIAVQDGPGVEGMSLAREIRRRGWHLVHRLDKDCSGVLILAKTSQAAREVCKALRLRTRDVQKDYIALVCGIPKSPRGVISSMIDGKPAKSLYQVVKSVSNKDVSVLKLLPLTGRKRQLRIHCRFGLGFPIAGDQKIATGLVSPFSITCLKYGINLCLHSNSVVVQVFGTILKARAPLPSHFLNALRLVGVSEQVATLPPLDPQDFLQPAPGDSSSYHWNSKRSTDSAISFSPMRSSVPKSELRKSLKPKGNKSRYHLSRVAAF